MNRKLRHLKLNTKSGSKILLTNTKHRSETQYNAEYCLIMLRKTNSMKNALIKKFNENALINKGISLTNNDNVYGRVDAITVDTTSACNEVEPYNKGSFVTLVKNGTERLGLYHKLTCSRSGH